MPNMTNMIKMVEFHLTALPAHKDELFMFTELLL